MKKMFNYVGKILRVKAVRLDKGMPLPKYAHFGDDAGMDLFASEAIRIPKLETRAVGTGLALQIPKGYVGLVHPRSGLAFKNSVTVLNAPGTIDAGYTGEIKVALHNTSPKFDFKVERGQRIAQIVFQKIEIVEFDEYDSVLDFDKSARGDNGYGSTG